MQKAVRIYFAYLEIEINKEIQQGWMVKDTIVINDSRDVVVIFESIAGIRHSKISNILDVDIQDIIDKYHTTDNYDSMLQTYRIKEEDVKKIIAELNDK